MISLERSVHRWIIIIHQLVKCILNSIMDFEWKHFSSYRLESISKKGSKKIAIVNDYILYTKLAIYSKINQRCAQKFYLIPNCSFYSYMLPSKFRLFRRWCLVECKNLNCLFSKLRNRERKKCSNNIRNPPSIIFLSRNTEWSYCVAAAASSSSAAAGAAILFRWTVAMAY